MIDKLMSCGHASPSAQGAEDEAEGLLHRADRLLDAASNLKAASVHRDLMEDILREAHDTAEEAEDVLARATAEEELAQSSEASAEAAAGGPVPATPAAALEHADGLVTQAATIVGTMRSGRARLLADRCRSVRQRVAMLRRLYLD